MKARITALWQRFRSWKPWQQYVAWAVLAVLVIFIIHSLTASDTGAGIEDSLPTVTLAPVSSLSSSDSAVNAVGTVRSESEANILAQSGGVVQAVHSRLGASVPAGYALAELENSSQAAAVLQAQGSYEAALAARSALSLPDSQKSAADTYASAYTTLDTVIENDIDTFFGSPTPYGPNLLLSTGSGTGPASLSSRRVALQTMMDAWRKSLATANTRDPIELLTEAEANAQTVSKFLTDLARVANETDSGATETQIAGLASARSSVDALISTIITARGTYRSGSSQATAGADANVKQALGSLRAAQSNFEKTIIRAPIGGTVNFLSVHVGDYVSALTHVATVAQNGALEIVAYVSSDERNLLSVGAKVGLEGGARGVITSISPALNPETKQIEVHIAVEGETSSALENGQSVSIMLPNAPVSTGATATSTGPLLLPLTTLKLTPTARVVFSVGEDDRLVAHPVDIGDVVGDRIEITTQLAADLTIVTDARGLSEGEKVRVATTP
jgi:RND family efflux transporter MFP subunit